LKDWNILPAIEASQLLFYRCLELLLSDKKYNISTDTTVRLLTQRLHGDYRQVFNTPEYKRAEKHVSHFKNTGLGKELF
jgi:hypothetical protein